MKIFPYPMGFPHAMPLSSPYIAPTRLPHQVGGNHRLPWRRHHHPTCLVKQSIGEYVYCILQKDSKRICVEMWTYTYFSGVGHRRNWQFRFLFALIHVSLQTMSKKRIRKHLLQGKRKRKGQNRLMSNNRAASRKQAASLRAHIEWGCTCENQEHPSPSIEAPGPSASSATLFRKR